MDEHYIWLFNKSDNSGLWWASLFSFLLHVAMFAVMATTSVFYPITSASEKIDVVWLYPSFLLGGETDAPPPVQSSPVQEKAPSPLAGSAKASSPRQPPPIEPEPARKTETRGVGNLPLLSPPPAREEEAKYVAPPAAAPLSTEEEPFSPPLQTAEAKAGQGEKGEANGGPPADGNESASTAAEKSAVAPAVAADTIQPAATATATRETPPQNQKHLDAVQQTRVRDSVPLPQTAETSPLREKPLSPGAPAQTLLLPVSSGGERKAALEMRSEPAPNTKHVNGDKPVEKPPANAAGPKGIFAPPLSGDLKLEITATPEALKAVKISAIFREYPKARRDRPMTKSAARNFRTLSPKMARTAPNALQAVVEIAEEGVYDFRNLYETADSVEATFRVKIHENSGRAKTQPAGTRKIGDKGSIVKVLMPDGILWDDESAFSGNMEDSESITRFNAETGLVWKEYKE